MTKRVLLKISWEALQWERDNGIDPQFLRDLAASIKEIQDQGVELAIVLWGGNIFRWLAASANGMDRTAADYMGMIATIMNGVAFKDALSVAGVDTRLMSALHLPEVAEYYVTPKAVHHLKQKRVVICVAGSGSPFFTTDSAAVLRALEMQCDMCIKATKVDGVYDSDPKTNPGAQMIQSANYDEVLTKNIRVMDHTAITLAKEGNMPLKVVNLYKKGAMMRAINGEREGTVIS